MILEYKAGRTPNPDVFCNKYIKFGVFFDWAMNEGADFVATGHYARVEKKGNDFLMLAGKDRNKDQSYFLWTLGQKQLSKTLFPVGDLEKSEVRKLAKKFKLPNAARKDSQGLCFVGPVNVKDFLAEYAPQQEGNVLDSDGKIIGRHPGALFFTVGERHGFVVTEKTPNDAPYFVISKDMKKNTITVGHKNESLSGMKKEFDLESVNWVVDAPIKDKKYTARVRHLGDCMSCVFDSNKVAFTDPVTVASGQSIVFYDGDICLGGGIIK